MNAKNKKFHFGKPWNPYRIYRAFKSGKRLFFIFRKYQFRLCWGPSLEQVQKKFPNSFLKPRWTVRPVLWF